MDKVMDRYDIATDRAMFQAGVAPTGD